MNQTDSSRFLFLVAPAKERVKELVSKRGPGAARPPCVVRDAPSALLTMTYVIDSIEIPPHPRPAPGQALRKPQRGCLEGRTVPPHPHPNPPPSRGRACVSTPGEGLCQRGGGLCRRGGFVSAGRAWVSGEGLCQRGGPVSAPPICTPVPSIGAGRGGGDACRVYRLGHGSRRNCCINPAALI